MSKCTKVKHPCKICLETVTQRTGLQCQGACQSWVHYNCLNYTPGRIKDIKAGIIRVTCPCPDCKTIMPKEYRTDQPYSCSNQQCPANRPPKCENQMCPINDSERRAAPPPTCPLGTCGTKCKQNSTPQLPYADVPPCPPMQPCVPLPPQPKPSPSMSDGCLNPNRCSSGCSSTSPLPRRDVPGDYSSAPVSRVPSFRVVEDMCNTIGLLKNQLNDLMSKMQNLTENQTDVSGGVQRGYKPAATANSQRSLRFLHSSTTPCTCRSKKKLI